MPSTNTGESFLLHYSSHQNIKYLILINSNNKDCVNKIFFKTIMLLIIFEMISFL